MHAHTLTRGIHAHMSRASIVDSETRMHGFDKKKYRGAVDRIVDQRIPERDWAGLDLAPNFKNDKQT